MEKTDRSAEKRYEEAELEGDDSLTAQNQAEFSLLERDWELRLDVIEKEGFRAGVESGQDKRMQEGFNKGYRTAAERIYKLSVCRGLIDAMFAINNSSKGTNISEEDIEELQKLTSKVSHLDTAVKSSTRVSISSQDCEKETCCGGSGKEQDDNSVESTVSQKSPNDSNQADSCAGASSKASGHSEDGQPMHDGTIEYEQKSCSKDTDFSLISEEISNLDWKVHRILEKYDLFSASVTQSVRKS